MTLLHRRPGSTQGTGGFSLVELLVVLVILSVLAAIVIPAMINALDKGRQKRTMADLRLLGGSIETYSVDNSNYPIGDATDLSVLVPEYTNTLVSKDAWNHDLIYIGTALDYTLGSAGKNGGATLALTGSGGPSKDFDDDIIYRTGTFVQWPEGIQN